MSFEFDLKQIFDLSDTTLNRMKVPKNDLDGSCRIVISDFYCTRASEVDFGMKSEANLELLFTSEELNEINFCLGDLKVSGNLMGDQLQEVIASVVISDTVPDIGRMIDSELEQEGLELKPGDRSLLEISVNNQIFELAKDGHSPAEINARIGGFVSKVANQVKRGVGSPALFLGMGVFIPYVDVKIASHPAGAEVFCSGGRLGVTPVKVGLQSGKRYVFDFDASGKTRSVNRYISASPDPQSVSVII